MRAARGVYHRRRSIARAFVFGVAALGIPACRATDQVQPAVAPLTVTGDSSVDVSRSVILTAKWDTVRVPANERVIWTSSDLSVAFTTDRAQRSNDVAVIGRRAGVATVTATSAAGVARHVVTVRDERPMIRAVMGDSIPGQLVDGVAKERVSVTLAAGDTIDIGITTSDWELTNFRVERTGTDTRLERVLLGPGTYIYGIVPWSGPGTFDFEVAAALTCSSRSCRGSATYSLHVRRSAAIFNFASASYRGFSLPQGGRLSDTAWVQNFGVGAMTADVSSDGPWLRPDASSVTVLGPTEVRQLGGPVPTGAVAVVSTVDATVVTPGRYSSKFNLNVPAGVWTSDRLVKSLSRHLEVRVFDSTVRVISRSVALAELAATPDGRLYGARNDSVFVVDPTSGATTPLVGVPRAATPQYVYQLGVGPDSALYVGVRSNSGDSIYTMANGALKSLMGWPAYGWGGFVVADDGTMYAFNNRQLFRRRIGGTQEVIAAATWTPRGLVYRRADDALYFIDGGQLQRYDIGRRVTEPRGVVEAYSSYLAVDAAGRLYKVSNDASSILVLDTSARVLDRVVTPEYMYRGFALSSTSMFVSTDISPLIFWSAPLR